LQPSRKEYETILLEVLTIQKFLADDISEISNGFFALNSKYPPEVTATIIKYAFSNEEMWEKICENYFSFLAQTKDK
jgi:hypothetical protein